MLYFTVVTNNRLPYAHVLMQRLAELDPTSERLVFMVENEPFPDLVDPCFEVVRLESYVEAAAYPTLFFQYSTFELCTALKVYAHHHVYHHTNYQKWMFFDADIYPLASCRDLMDEAPDAFLFLTPHLLIPKPLGQASAIETLILQCGVFNSGYVGIRRTHTAGEFIAWYLERARSLFFLGYRHMFVDQLWLDLAPSLFPNVHSIRHPGANIGHWNLSERALHTDENGMILCNGILALFLHFSGWSPRTPYIVSKYNPAVVSNVTWNSTADRYAAELFAADLDEAENATYGWGRFSDGSPIELNHRRQFYEDKQNHLWPEGLDPFNEPQRFSPPHEEAEETSVEQPRENTNESVSESLNELHVGESLDDIPVVASHLGGSWSTRIAKMIAGLFSA